MTNPLAPDRITVEAYHELGRTGVLSEDDRVELLYGKIVPMTPIGPRHAFLVSRLTANLQDRLGKRCCVWCQNPVTIPAFDSEPQPDIALLRLTDDYWNRLPNPADALLAIEVADSSLAKDRRIKLPLYAEAGVLETWIIDISRDDALVIEVHRNAQGGEYTESERRIVGDRIAPVAFPDAVFEVERLTR